MDSYSLSHSRYKCQYHVVFIPKYRKRIMYGKLKADVREIIKRLCDYRNIEIIEGAVCADHVHLCLSIPPSEKVSDVIAYIKGKSALMIHDKYPEMVNGWSKSFWARGYYVATVGNITANFGILPLSKPYTSRIDLSSTASMLEIFIRKLS